MQQRCLGRSELVVSEISLGTVELGLNYGIPVAGENVRPSEREATVLLNRALDLGVTFIDTARAYGASEEIIGRSLEARRDEYVLASKLGVIKDDELSDMQLAEQVKVSIGESLRALRTDRLDLLQLHHAPLDLVRRGRVCAAMQEAQRAGLVRFIGASTYGEEAALAVLEDGRFDTLQIAYNLVDRSLEERVLPLAQQKGVGIIVRSVLLRGVLSHRFSLIPDCMAELRSAIAELAGLAEGEHVALPELAYRFVLSHPAVSTALVGTSRIDELEAALSYASGHRLAPGVLERVREVVVTDRRQLNPGTWPAQLGG